MGLACRRLKLAVDEYFFFTGSSGSNCTRFFLDSCFSY